MASDLAENASLVKLAKPKPQEKNRLEPGKEAIWGGRKEIRVKTLLGRRNHTSPRMVIIGETFGYLLYLSGTVLRI